jgi:hypothetical protein
MTAQPISDPNTPIGEILKAAGSEGIVLQSADQMRYAVIPLDDDVLDLLIERNPKFRAHCREIRARMDTGHFRTHEEIKNELAPDRSLDQTEGLAPLGIAAGNRPGVTLPALAREELRDHRRTPVLSAPGIGVSSFFFEK